MLETELRELFERQASGDQPPTAITSQQVIQQGRSRLRARRAGVVAAPLLAAAIVAAIVVTTALPSALPAKPRHHPLAPPPVPTAPQYFDPLRLYPSFGWLPAGTHVISGETGPTTQNLNAAQAGGPMTWQLTVHAGGQCSTSGMVLHCAGASSLFDVPMTTQLPEINGLPAYWNVNQVGQGILVFEYARDGWAELEFRDQADAVRVAASITFGASSASPIFPVQLTGLPGWRLRYEMFNPTAQGSLAAGIIGFASGAAVDAPGLGSPTNYPSVNVSKAGSGGSCYFTAGESSISVIAGYSVTVTRAPTDSVEELCVADADGLTVDVIVNGNQPAIDVTQVFAHLRLLGPDPAHWSTSPVG